MDGGDAMKQPDLFAQVVRNAVRGQGTTNNRWYLYPEDAEKLLRRQHSAIVRLVKRRKVNLGRFIDKDLLLDVMERYRKGTR